MGVKEVLTSVGWVGGKLNNLLEAGEPLFTFAHLTYLILSCTILPRSKYWLGVVWMLNIRRSNIEIIADMLRVGNNGNGAGKTEIMYSANMSYAQIQKYLAFLMDQDLINKIQVGNPSIKYHVTDKGTKLLQSIDDIMEMLGLEEGIDF